METERKKKSSTVLKVLLAFGLLMIIAGGGIAYVAWKYLKKPNIDLHGNEVSYLYIPTGATFNTVKDSLAPYLTDKNTFVTVSERKHYTSLIKPGRYKIRNGMNNNDLINMLRAGWQDPVKLAFSNARTRNDLANKLTAHLEMKPEQFRSLLDSSQFLESYGFDTATVSGMFIPNTYEVLWTISPEALFKRMNDEYNKFWTASRRQKAEAINMTPKEVSTLASIVQSETIKKDEKPRIAGVYINRLRIGMKLEADPTLKFAIGNFAIKRFWQKDFAVESPYNTYKYAGLPPGPICVPDAGSIDAVLNYEKNNYLYFCAKEDFSGYSNFASTLAEHLRNARKFQEEENRRGIYR